MPIPPTTKGALPVTRVAPGRWDARCGACLAPTPVVEAATVEEAAEAFLAAGWTMIRPEFGLTQFRCLKCAEGE